LPRIHPVLYPRRSTAEASPKTISRRTSYHRGPSGFSPLPTTHPETIPRLWVRPSTWCYPRFSLAMGRSPGFVPTARDWSPCSDSLSLRLRPTDEASPVPRTVARRIILQKACRQAAGSAGGHLATPRAKGRRDPPTVCERMVSGSLSLPFRGSFHRSLAVLVHYRSAGSI